MIYPNPGALKRLTAMKVGALHRDDDHSSSRLAIRFEGLEQTRTVADCCLALDPESLIRSWDKKVQCDPRIVNEIVQGFYAVVANTIRN